MNTTGKTIAIAGAGSIGGYIGGLLALGGHDVRLLARPAMIDRVTRGLELSSFDGLSMRVPPDQLCASDDPSVLAGADLILVTVKSGATREMADLISRWASPESVIISLQNGVGNADILKTALPGADIRAGMVPFNVVQTGAGLHRGTSGNIAIAPGWGDWADILSVPHLTIEERQDMPQVLWGKLLLNLNNALNALSGLTLYDQLSDRGWRKLIAEQQEEALAVLGAAGIVPAKATPLPPAMLPRILRLPTPLFRIVSGRMLKIDRTARSSMWEDLERGRTTEIDVLQGAVMALAGQHDIPVPMIARVAGLVRAAEVRGEGSPGLSPEEVTAGHAG